MKKFLALAILPLIFSTNVEAAAVAGEDDWKDLEELEELDSSKPYEIGGKVKLNRRTLNAPSNYPATFGQNQTTLEGQIDFRLRFASKWYLRGRLQDDYVWAGGDHDNDFDLKQLYVDGKIGVFEIRGGKIPIFDALNLSSGGLVIDSEIIGGQVRVPIGNFKIIASGGVIDNDDYSLTRVTTIFDTDSTYLSLQTEGDLSEKISISAGIHNMHNTAGGLTLPNGIPYSPGGQGFFESGTEKNNTVWTAGFDYHISDDFTFGGIYSGGSAKITKQAQTLAGESTDETKSYSVQLTYGHPEIEEKNNLTSWIAYRQAGRVGSYNPAFHGVGFGERGFEIGAQYRILKDLSCEVTYFNGEKISKISAAESDNPDVKKWYLGVKYEF